MFEDMVTHDSIQRAHSCILIGHFLNNAGVLFNSDSVSVMSPVFFGYFALYGLVILHCLRLKCMCKQPQSKNKS